MSIAHFYSIENKIYDPFKLKEDVLIIGQVQSGKTKFMIDTCIKGLSTNFDCAIILGGNNKNLINQTRNRLESNFNRSKIRIIEIESTIYKELPKDGKTLITSLKSLESLSKLLSLLQYSIPKRIMIFDDESDYGSINISKSNKPSKIFELIKAINDSMEETTFFSVTATPFADIVSNKAKKFDRIVSLEPSFEYTGSSFFQKHSPFEILSNEKVIRNFEYESIDIWKKIILSHVSRILESNLKETQLLINCDLSTQKHLKLKQKIEMCLKDIIDKTLLRPFFGDEYQNAKCILENLLKNTFTLNGNGFEWNTESHSVLIGGTLVSRGYTFEKLLTTVLFNESESKMSADTLLQRARWFGYRNNIHNFMKVFVSKRIFEAFEEVNVIVEFLADNSNTSLGQEKLKQELKNMKFNNIILTGKV